MWIDQLNSIRVLKFPCPTHTKNVNSQKYLSEFGFDTNQTECVLLHFYYLKIFTTVSHEGRTVLPRERWQRDACTHVSLCTWKKICAYHLWKVTEISNAHLLICSFTVVHIFAQCWRKIAFHSHFISLANRYWRFKTEASSISVGLVES